MAVTFGELGRIVDLRGRVEEALEWMVRGVAFFDEFPHPMTGVVPKYLVRLATELGIESLERCWQRVTGQPLSEAVRAFVVSGPAQGED